MSSVLPRDEEIVGCVTLSWMANEQHELVSSCNAKLNPFVRVENKVVALHVVLTHFPVQHVVRFAIQVAAFEKERLGVLFLRSNALELLLRDLE